MKTNRFSRIFLLCSMLTAHGVYANNTTESLDAALQTVSPKLAQTNQFLADELWQRPQLSMKERSLITLAAAIARDQQAILGEQIQGALDNGVSPQEVSEVITHLAFYAGWGNAMSAVKAAAPIYQKLGIKSPQIEPSSLKLLPIDEKAEAARAKFVSANFGKVSEGVVQYTTDKLFKDLWLRPNLAPKNRSLITVSALIATGQAEQVPYHLNKAMDNGLTQAQASELLTQLAFYAGWPKVFSALPVVKKVFESRNISK
ncbi:carboxymuconolactone decarboxylase family protein [Vibrio mangrovi]|uniref:Carboxymuconolactone decarboxylase family protein n=1 Tax=Vibrio mangrovi TaxID=474394 RepID=A0A1Y6ITS1_9VIBR|nr:carboxymuconolactone decarboxylase family protein [Vibrio mangrovi]MDW6004786.1 carboxymuconolactone decarboxylase family protein [Vibrio mangrovi]SMS01077.1 Carboxymuconolactone decarboxylase family protein [Vibrio mangrovi]